MMWLGDSVKETYARTVDRIDLHTSDAIPSMGLNVPDPTLRFLLILHLHPIRIILALDLLLRCTQSIPSTFRILTSAL